MLEVDAALECKVTDVYIPRALSGPVGDTYVICGEVVGVHINERILTDGLVDYSKARTIARLGYAVYAEVVETFSMRRPDPVEDGSGGA